MESNPLSISNYNHRPVKPQQDNLKVPLRLKKSSSNGLFRLFSKGSSNQGLKSPSEAPEKNALEKWEDPVAAGLRDIGLEVRTCNYIRPTGLKLEPRREDEYRRENLTSDFLPSSLRQTPQKISLANRESKPDTTSTISSLPKMSQAKEAFRNRVKNSHLLIKDSSVKSNLQLTVDNLPSVSPICSPMWSPLMSPVTPVNATGPTAYASIKPQFVVGRIAMDDEFSPMWTSWLKSYSKGEFNIQNPPEPPPLGSTFTHLPAIYPDNEEMRSTASKIHDHLWRGFAHDRANLHLRGVRKKFGTRFGAISFFDEDYEQFKAEKGYSVKNIQRSNSIAAHALYSTEVLSILDTQMDWRFRGNPMVTGKPRIRFFAATPLVNEDGDILGVLSIFSLEKREVFTYDQRRQLAECGAALVTELMGQLEFVRMPKPVKHIATEAFQSPNSGFQRVSQTQRDMPNGADHFHRNVSVVDRNSARENPLPPPPVPPPPVPKYPNFDPPAQPPGRVLSRTNTSRSPIFTQTTPPSSVKSSQRPSPEGARDFTLRSRVNSAVSRLEPRPRGDSLTLSHKTTSTSRTTSKTCNDCDLNQEFKRHENLEDPSCSPYGIATPHSSFPVINHGSLRGKTTPSSYEDSPSYEFNSCPISRPFSSSDLISLNPLPPNSPLQTVDNQDLSHHPNLDMTVEDFLSLSDGDLVEDSAGILSTEINLSKYTHFPNSSKTNNVNFPEGRFSNNYHESTDYNNNHYKVTTNMNRSFTSCLQAKSRIPDSLLMWKFPRCDPMLPDTDSLRTNDKDLRCNGSSHSNSPPFVTPTTSPMRNDTYHNRISHDKQILCESSNRMTSDNSVEVQSELTGNYSPVTSSRKDISCPSERQLAPDIRRPSAASLTRCTVSPQRFFLDTLSQAAIDLALYSKRSGYGLIYVAKVSPINQNIRLITEADTTAPRPNGIKLSLLTAHGLSDKIHLCPLVHTRVLRSRGLTNWEDLNEKDELIRGMLVAIETEGGPLRERNTSFILGTFREAMPDQASNTSNLINETKVITELVSKIKMTLTTSVSTSYF